MSDGKAPCALAFPSPASAHSTSTTPLLERAPKPFPARPAEYGQLDAGNDLLAADPDPVCSQPLLTPPVAQSRVVQDLDIVCGGALAPTHSELSQPNIAPLGSKRVDLQLPSFHELGIAVPHPDRIDSVDVYNLSASIGTSITPDSIGPHDSGAELSPMMSGMKPEADVPPTIHEPPCEAPSQKVQSPAYQYGDPLTPPDDIPFIDWTSTPAIRAASSGSEHAASGLLPSEAGSTGAPTSASPRAGDGRAPQALPDQPAPWYRGAIGSIVENVRTAPNHLSSLRILSHALPSPSPSGHIFSTVIAALQETSPVESWINVFHAIPGRFNLADLPRSPPSTPGPAVGGSDYFTEKVFDSAVSIADYQEDLSRLPRSPRAVVPPSSIDISIVERYIPPSSSNEFDRMFELHGASILVDRMKELSPNNGSLLLIYPTRAGGNTFMKDYLSPILDPVLRSMAVVNGLSASLASMLGNMTSVDRLSDHETYKARIQTLLNTISRGGPAVERVFEQGSRPRFTLAYASAEHVVVDRSTWAQEWWTKQEKPRVREAVTKYAREAQTRSSNFNERPRTSTELLQEVLKGVAEKPYPPEHEPTQGIEVSCFVVCRTG